MDENQEIITNYLQKYTAANGFPYKGGITYERGWFCFYGPVGLKRYRRGDVQEMARNLEIRICRAAALSDLIAGDADLIDGEK